MGLSNAVRLGVSPAAPTPTGVFTQRFEALFPRAGALGYNVGFAPCRLVYLVLPATLPVPFSTTLSRPSGFICANVGPQGLLVVRLPALLVPHSASLSPSAATRVLSTPVPVSAPPTGLDVCFFFIYLVSDFLAL